MGNDSQKVVLITGASSGIGKATAKLLSKNGYKVYGTSRKDIKSDFFEMVQMDVTDDTSVSNAIDYIVKKEGKIDILINNAGVGVAGPIEDTYIDEVRHQFEINFIGVVKTCQKVLPVMREKGGGLIINIASMAGQIGLPFQGFYSASKFAVEGFSEALRLEVMQFGVDIVIVEPGDIATPFTSNRWIIHRHRKKEKTPYLNSFRKTIEIIEKDEESGLPAEVVAKKILKIIRSKHRRFRYMPGSLSQRIVFILKRFLPYKLYSNILISHYKVPKFSKKNKENRYITSFKLSI